jgi:hypothetical protein
VRCVFKIDERKTRRESSAAATREFPFISREKEKENLKRKKKFT